MKNACILDKKNEFLNIFIGILMAFIILASEGTFLSAEEIGCGSIIGPGETVTLKGDIGPCNNNPVLNIVGPAQLNLNGFTVYCLDRGNEGILVTGEKAIIHNGTVKDCSRGVHVRGEGSNKIVNLTVYNCKDDAIRVRSGSDNNQLVNNTAKKADRGIRIESKYNYLINNYASDNNKGIRIEGDNNKVVGNEADNNFQENFQIRGNNNRLVNNSANGGPEECFLIDGNSNELINNTATNCKDSGFELSNDENQKGDYNIISNCMTSGNKIGIFADYGAQNNTITHNTSLDNIYKDLQDADCFTNNNVWEKNKFETYEGGCID